MHKRAKRSALSQQVITGLKGTDKTRQYTITKINLEHKKQKRSTKEAPPWNAPGGTVSKKKKKKKIRNPPPPQKTI